MASAGAQRQVKIDNFTFAPAGIVVAPGVGFGPGGEGYIRMALVTHDNRFHDALLRFKKLLAPEKSMKEPHPSRRGDSRGERKN